MRPVDTIVTSPLHDEEAKEAKDVYIGAEEQTPDYDSGIPAYSRFVVEAIASMKPSSVLEFGCNAGRNLDLLRKIHPDARYVGVDVNPLSVERGRKRYGLDLLVSDEAWLRSQSTDSFDVAFTVSVIDHIPYPEEPLRHLLRISRHNLVLFELAHDRVGLATHNMRQTESSASLVPVYRNSYIHDYRYECEKKFGCICTADIRYPIGSDNLLDLYRLYVFTKRWDQYSVPQIANFSMKPVAS